VRGEDRGDECASVEVCLCNHMLHGQHRGTHCVYHESIPSAQTLLYASLRSRRGTDYHCAGGSVACSACQHIWTHRGGLSKCLAAVCSTIQVTPQVMQPWPLSSRVVALRHIKCSTVRGWRWSRECHPHCYTMRAAEPRDE
jgi:hypothetical protein